jgi:hypothetical protein
VIHLQRMVVSGHQFPLLHYLKLGLGPCPFFCIFKGVFFVVLPQHFIMVFASSSKSNLSQAKSIRAPLKTGPPLKKAVAVSMAQAKKTKQESIKKYIRKGKYFFH